MTNKSAYGRYDPAPPDTDAERAAAILSDLPAMRVERLRLLVAISAATDAYSIAIWLRRVDKIEEQFHEIGLTSDGIEPTI